MPLCASRCLGNRRLPQLQSLRDNIRVPIHRRDWESLPYPPGRTFRRHDPLYTLPLFSGTALGLSVATAARHRSALASPPWQVLVPPSRAPSKKARFGLGSRALREASPGVP